MRPDNLAKIVQRVSQKNRRIYVFIDLSRFDQNEKNAAVYQQAIALSKRHDIKLYRSSKPLGVGLAVPTAIEWFFSFEEQGIVLEDDCIPTPQALQFFDFEIYRVLQGQYSMLCGTSATDLPGSSFGRSKLVTSQYPLISGWATTAISWKLISTQLHGASFLSLVIRRVASSPRLILPLAYFLAAMLNVRHQRLKAWDSPVALNMLLHDRKSLLSNATFIENIGLDAVAANTHSVGGDSNVYRKASEHQLSSELDASKETRFAINRIIENEIYALKPKHIMSPLKALLSIYFCREIKSL